MCVINTVTDLLTDDVGDRIGPRKTEGPFTKRSKYKFIFYNKFNLIYGDRYIIYISIRFAVTCFSQFNHLRE